MAQFVGTVIGTKMNKTAKILVTRLALYNKLKTVSWWLLSFFVNFHKDSLYLLFSLNINFSRISYAVIDPDRIFGNF